MLLNRRKTLTLLGSAPLLTAPSLGTAQSFGRQPLPEWVHLNRKRGKSWQNQRTRTIRMDKTGRYIQGAEWDPRNKNLLRLFYFNDPKLKIQNELFKLYEVRSEEELERNPTEVEDIAWPTRTMLNERIWTSYYSAANELWGEIFNTENPNYENIELRSDAKYLWAFPTNDEPPEDVEAHIDMAEDNLLANTLKAMIDKEIAFAGVPESNGDFRDFVTGAPFGNVYMGKMPPGSRRHRYIYFVILSPVAS